MRIEDNPASLEGSAVRAEAGIRAARVVLGQPGAASLRSGTIRALSHGTEDHFFARLPSLSRVDALVREHPSEGPMGEYPKQGAILSCGARKSGCLQHRNASLLRLMAVGLMAF